MSPASTIGATAGRIVRGGVAATAVPTSVAATLVPRLPLPPDGWVRLRTTGLAGQNVLGQLTEPVKPDTPSGMTVVSRPGQIGIPVYTGRDPSGLSIKFDVDRFTRKQSVQAEYDLVEQMAGYDGPQPQVVVEGPGIPHAFHLEPRRRWYVDGQPDVTEESRDGVLCRIHVELTVRRLEPLTSDAVVKTSDQPPHVVRKGSKLDTLTEIARHYRTTWTRLRRLNERLPADPDRTLPVGTRVVIG